MIINIYYQSFNFSFLHNNMMKCANTIIYTIVIISYHIIYTCIIMYSLLLYIYTAFLKSDWLPPQNLEEIMQPTRDAMEWPLSQMDREVGISFGSNFHFALSALLFKGFSHPLSTVRTRTQELLTTVFFLHSSEGCLRYN